MNKITCLLCLCLCVASCKKDSTPTSSSTSPSVTWYEGLTLYTATHITATLPNPYVYGNYHVLSASSGSHTLRIVISTTGVGNYNEQFGDQIVIESDTLPTFELSVTANSGNTMSGGFSSIASGVIYDGSFSNILFQ